MKRQRLTKSRIDHNRGTTLLLSELKGVIGKQLTGYTQLIDSLIHIENTLAQARQPKWWKDWAADVLTVSRQAAHLGWLHGIENRTESITLPKANLVSRIIIKRVYSAAFAIGARQTQHVRAK